MPEKNGDILTLTWKTSGRLLCVFKGWSFKKLAASSITTAFHVSLKHHHVSIIKNYL